MMSAECALLQQQATDNHHLARALFRVALVRVAGRVALFAKAAHRRGVGLGLRLHLARLWVGVVWARVCWEGGEWVTVRSPLLRRRRLENPPPRTPMHTSPPPPRTQQQTRKTPSLTIGLEREERLKRRSSGFHARPRLRSASLDDRKPSKPLNTLPACPCSDVKYAPSMSAILVLGCGCGWLWSWLVVCRG